MTDFWFGLGLGILLTVPLAVLWVRRERRRVQRLAQRARSAERLAELGRLTGGLAHEIKNPLSTIGLNLQLVQEDLRELAAKAPPDTLPEGRLGRLLRRFDALGRELQRLRNILEDFLRFAGRIRLDRADVDVNALVAELVDFYAPQAQAARINLRTQLAAQPATTLADPELLKQALLNLLINATHAMTQAAQAGRPHGGCTDLIVRTERRRTLGQSEIRIHVTDTGPGIAPEQLEGIFQPYFSTKKQGTGLGLPTARRIVEEHGGTLTVDTSVGRGSDFVVSLPDGTATVAAATAAQPSLADAQRTKT